MSNTIEISSRPWQSIIALAASLISLISFLSHGRLTGLGTALCFGLLSFLMFRRSHSTPFIELDSNGFTFDGRRFDFDAMARCSVDFAAVNVFWKSAPCEQISLIGVPRAQRLKLAEMIRAGVKQAAA